MFRLALLLMCLPTILWAATIQYQVNSIPGTTNGFSANFSVEDLNGDGIIELGEVSGFSLTGGNGAYGPGGFHFSATQSDLISFNIDLLNAPLALNYRANASVSVLGGGPDNSVTSNANGLFVSYNYCYYEFGRGCNPLYGYDSYATTPMLAYSVTRSSSGQQNAPSISSMPLPASGLLLFGAVAALGIWRRKPVA